MSLPLRRHGELPRPSLRQIVVRGSGWAVAATGLAVGLGWDTLTGRRSEVRTGLRLRRLFERVGGTAVKLGQQLSIRSDVLPQAVCDQLATLNDRVPPIPPDQVRGLLEAELGRPLEELFVAFDPEPIGSASVACVYRATLPDGREVAVKLRRPGVVERFAADVAVLDRVLRLLEILTVFRDGTFAHLRQDLRTLLGEETSFRLEARFQRLFRDEVRKAGMTWITAPEVIGALSSDAVLVSRFVDGLPMTRLLADLESGSTRDLGVDPSRLARRLARFSLWARFEARFFHADPHPGNVFVLPGDRLVLVDFGGCGVTSARTRRNHVEILRQTIRGDRSKVARIALADLSPVPRLDTDAFLRDTEAAFSALMLALHHPDAHWSERIVVSVWLRLLQVTRQYQIRVNLDTVRSIRAFLLYDTLAARLDPDLGFGTSRRYLRESLRRQARTYIGNESPPARGADVVRTVTGAVEALTPLVDRVQVTWQRLARAQVVATRGGLRVGLAGLAAVAVWAMGVRWLVPLTLGWMGLIAARSMRETLYALHLPLHAPLQTRRTT